LRFDGSYLFHVKAHSRDFRLKRPRLWKMSGWVTSSKSRMKREMDRSKSRDKYLITFGCQKIKVKPAVFSRVVLNETSQNNSQLLEGGGAPNSSQFQAKAAGAAEVSKRVPEDYPCRFP